jgi:hypothetical protein
MSARVFYVDADEASAALETLRSFGLRAVIIATTVAELREGTEHVEWEVIALDLPAQQSDPPRAVGPIVDPHEDDYVSSAWDWEREDRKDRDREY